MANKEPGGEYIPNLVIKTRKISTLTQPKTFVLMLVLITYSRETPTWALRVYIRGVPGVTLF
jgi:hypothetical protein